MSLNLKEKYHTILAHEEQFAYRLAKDVVKKPEVSVWMILLPVLFVHHMMQLSQYKAGVQTFAQNILGTKRKALDKAFEEAESGKSVPYGMEEYFPQVSLTTTEEKTLAEKQIKMIRIMEEHYLALLHQPGQNLEDLVRGVYDSSGSYRYYLNKLTDAENEANQYLSEHFHKADESRTVLKKIQEQCEVLREEELRFFFQD